MAFPINPSLGQKAYEHGGLGVVTDLLLSGNYTVDIVGYYYNR